MIRRSKYLDVEELVILVSAILVFIDRGVSIWCCYHIFGYWGLLALLIEAVAQSIFVISIKYIQRTIMEYWRIIFGYSYQFELLVLLDDIMRYYCCFTTFGVWYLAEIFLKYLGGATYRFLQYKLDFTKVLLGTRPPPPPDEPIADDDDYSGDEAEPIKPYRSGG
jgi:hypothetical protein